MLRILLAADRSDVRDAVLDAAGADDQIEVVAVARNWGDLVRQVKALRPGLVVMGVGLKPLDGVETIKEVMTEAPTPIVLVFDPDDAEAVALSADALKAGALAIVPVPGRGGPAESTTPVARFLSTLKAMAQVKVVRRWREPTTRRLDPDTISGGRPPGRIVGIAASTGGPAAMKAILERLPVGFPVPILAVQHMSTGFTDSVAAWLDAAVPLTVKVARHGDLLEPGIVYIAPERQHLGVAGRTRVLLSDEPPINGFRPSGTFLFRSIARVFSAEAVAVILTGMGNDGAEGLRAVFEGGGDVLAQDEESSIVFGMPKVAIDAGLAHRVLPPEGIAAALLARVRGG
jgi:two-component system, chemotaxis family, protein-glutamate methylesterase/glutaminase